MKVEITATEKVTRIEGVPVRLWEGITERGTKCKVFVHRIAVHKEDIGQRELEIELQECLPPGRVVDLRQILGLTPQEPVRVTDFGEPVPDISGGQEKNNEDRTTKQTGN